MALSQPARGRGRQGGASRAQRAELEANLESKIRELRATVYAAQAGQAGGSSGFEGQGFSGATPQTRECNVFDPRDLKLAELGAKPSVARWKKWRRDSKGLVDTIGIS